MRESKELKVITQNYSVWFIKVLLTVSAWLVCSFLIYSGLRFFKIGSPDYSIFIAAMFSALAVGLAGHRFFYKY